MGIHGLLPQLKSIMTPIAVKDLRGQTVAVDTYSWLHKGALSCSMHLCKGIPTSKHIDYCMHRVNLLRHHGVKPILVFDGGLLPMKIEQETRRARARKENLERALEHEATGNSAAAYECYQKAVDISPSIACELIQVLKKEKVDYIVAPYEADAQMTFLSINKLVDAVITEDSDLIPFGCFRIIYKMDKFGHGVEFNSSKLGKNKELDFTGFTKTMLLEMCIFSGCDYLQSLPGMGLKRAHALVQKFKSYEKVIKHLRYSAVVVPPLYEETFKKAMWAFQHQRVYDPAKEDIVHLSDILHNDFVLDLEFLGPWLSRDIVQGIAKGDIDPLTKMPFQGKEASTNWTQSENHPDKEFASVGGRKRLNLPVQKNVVTNYFCLASLEAKRKFIAPKAMPKRSTYMESSSPTIADHVSSLPDSAEEAVTCTSPESQRSLLSSANFVDLPPEDAVVDKSSSETENDKLADASSNGNINDSELPHCMLKTNNDALEPVLASDKEYSRKPKANGAKSSTICLSRRSSYFKKALVDENEHRSQHEDSTLDKQGVHGVLYGCPMSKSAPFANYHENSIIKRRKQSHSPDSYMGPLQYDKVPTGASLPKEDNSCKLTDESVNTEKLNLGCDISHLNNYSGIAEKSMERFMSLISSFRYSSGSRASGLRAPLKDVQNIRSRRLKIHNRQP